MPSDLNSSIALNPMMVWADLGLRALDMTVASTQNIGDGVDRLARAGASEPVPVVMASSGSAPDASASPAAATLALTAQLQRSTFDLLTRGWLQWMSSLGTFASMAASPGAVQGLMGQTVPLRFTGTSTAWRSATESSAGQVEAGSTSNGPARRRRAAEDEREALEHAVASQPRRRRTSARTKAKPRSRNA